MVEFRLGKEFGAKEYMVEVWDGGRIVALIHPNENGITVSSRNQLRMEANQSKTEVYIKFELPVYVLSTEREKSDEYNACPHEGHLLFVFITSVTGLRIRII